MGNLEYKWPWKYQIRIDILKLRKTPQFLSHNILFNIFCWNEDITFSQNILMMIKRDFFFNET